MYQDDKVAPHVNIQNIKSFFNLPTFIFWKIGNTGEFHFKSSNVAL